MSEDKENVAFACEFSRQLLKSGRGGYGWLQLRASKLVFASGFMVTSDLIAEAFQFHF